MTFDEAIYEICINQVLHRIASSVALILAKSVGRKRKGGKWVRRSGTSQEGLGEVTDAWSRQLEHGDDWRL
jgi:hypothetical protein